MAVATNAPRELVAFALRFGFVIWKRTWYVAAGNVLPFGAEIASIAQRIVEGRGFSSPFYVETGPTAWRKAREEHDSPRRLAGLVPRRWASARAKG